MSLLEWLREELPENPDSMSWACNNTRERVRRSRPRQARMRRLTLTSLCVFQVEEIVEKNGLMNEAFVHALANVKKISVVVIDTTSLRSARTSACASCTTLPGRPPSSQAEITYQELLPMLDATPPSAVAIHLSRDGCDHFSSMARVSSPSPDKRRKTRAGGSGALKPRAPAITL